MNDGAKDELRRFLGGGRADGGGSFGTDDLQGLLLQIAFAIMMVFMLAYFLFRADASREKQEQVLEIERQKLVLAADAVRAAHRARYGLAALLPDGGGAFDSALVLSEGKLVDVPSLRDAFRSGLAAAAADYADPLRLRRDWLAEVAAAAELDPADISPEGARWLDARADADIAAAGAAARAVGRGAAAALQRRWVSHPDEIGDPAVADILARFLAADERGRLLLVTDLSGALRARGLAAVADLAGERAVATFLDTRSGSESDPPAENAEQPHAESAKAESLAESTENAE